VLDTVDIGTGDIACNTRESLQTSAAVSGERIEKNLPACTSEIAFSTIASKCRIEILSPFGDRACHVSCYASPGMSAVPFTESVAPDEPLPPDVFAGIVDALATALIREFGREQETASSPRKTSQATDLHPLNRVV
jgi:hypothetical protein